jgi:transposase
MYEVFIGVDVSKDVLDYGFHFDNELKYFGQFGNTNKQIKKVVASLAERFGNADFSTWLVCFENTGVYSKRLLRIMHEFGIACVEQDPMTIKYYFSQSRGKTDQWDACRICLYAYERHQSLVLTEQPDKHIQQLKHLHSYRSRLVETKRNLQNVMSEKNIFIDSEILSGTKQINAQIIDHIKEAIKEVDDQIQVIISSKGEIEKNYKLATSVIGIGVVIATGMIIFTNNFKSITDPRKFATYTGIAPFPNQSGRRKGNNKVSRRANIPLKALISNGVQSAINHDPQIKKYKMRLEAKGKPNGVIFNNIKNKLVQRVFSVVKRGTPYIKLAH